MILHQYPGYTDETILDLTLTRIRQMVSVISERLEREARLHVKQQLNIAEVHARQLGNYLTGVAASKDASKAIAKAVESTRFKLDDEPEDESKEKELPSTQQVAAAMGVRRDGLIGAR